MPETIERHESYRNAMNEFFFSLRFSYFGVVFKSAVKDLIVALIMLNCVGARAPHQQSHEELDFHKVLFIYFT